MKETKGFWEGLGFAIVIFSICFGIGSCHRMMNNTGPMIQPTIQIHLK